MTPPMTPREKVALKPCPFCGGVNIAFTAPCYGGGIGVLCRTCHTNMDSRCESEDGAAESWNRRTALASGDQIPGPDDVTAPSQMGFLSALGEAAWEQPPHTGSGDHAELIATLRADRLPECSFDNGKTWELDSVGVAETFSRAAHALETLLAENAALREQVKFEKQVAYDENDRWQEAERKLAEAVGHVENLVERLQSIRDSSIVLIAARTFLSSKAVERDDEPNS